MPTKYIIPIISANERDNISMRVLISKITKLKKLQETIMQVAKTIRI
jgi:hypothetical protein